MHFPRVKYCIQLSRSRKDTNTGGPWTEYTGWKGWQQGAATMRYAVPELTTIRSHGLIDWNHATRSLLALSNIVAPINLARVGHNMKTNWTQINDLTPGAGKISFKWSIKKMSRHLETEKTGCFKIYEFFILAMLVINFWVVFYV